MEELVKRMQEQASMWAESGMRFVSQEICEKIPKMSPSELDEFDFGIIKLDDSGVIRIYNQTESEKANVPKLSAVGKNFFTAVAPCTNNSLFMGSFRKGVEKKEMNFIFPYTFTYKMKPTPVKVHLYRDLATQTNWIFVKF
ncbi:MAG TPA: photoactive yellow protein [Leptospiraceae bacterium]|nr:photoactive yellow protein [Leptospiraceae bacterium]HMY69095.1 hypothetical protein [Leptospiraceae bacterium]HMZ60859.1 photoactive yellow protein [Leptospiraceae bacterium]HNF13542.1 photoactive yellow protein [Leptospiraceae bacterium]HNF24035.1 photoactive yellow protein [Leptospiraceae bacterium]